MARPLLQSDTPHCAMLREGRTTHAAMFARAADMDVRGMRRGDTWQVPASDSAPDGQTSED